jgi:hypothetical protein
MPSCCPTVAERRIRAIEDPSAQGLGAVLCSDSRNPLQIEAHMNAQAVQPATVAEAAKDEASAQVWCARRGGRPWL